VQQRHRANQASQGPSPKSREWQVVTGGCHEVQLTPGKHTCALGTAGMLRRSSGSLLSPLKSRCGLTFWAASCLACIGKQKHSQVNEAPVSSTEKGTVSQHPFYAPMAPVTALGIKSNF
jgi:hypothetical protein